MSLAIPRDSRWCQSREKCSRDRRNEGVTFLRGVYRVRMRGVLRSFAYILKRRTFTAPNMLAQREKKKERESKRRKKRRETKIPVFRFYSGGGREKREKWMGKRETRKIKRRAENVEMYCVLKSLCPLSSRNIILFHWESSPTLIISCKTRRILVESCIISYNINNAIFIVSNREAVCY